jgi:hypothetical protein
MQTDHKDYSFVVFPFLKTHGAVSIGHLTFRSTDTTDGLSAEQGAFVNEIASMLFLQDNLRIRSASYAVVPFIDLSYQLDDVEYLMNVQAVVSYCYASPRHAFGDLFLSSEHATMVIFTPGRVSIYLVRQDFHVHAVELASNLVANHRREVEGYAGLYNFRHHFWVTKGSRLYGPKPHLTLNHAQDLRVDFDRMATARADFRLLSELLRKPDTQAFEALLNLSADEKTNRLTDAISLLLGRIPRLDIWARQFYDARSRIVHEGRTQQLRFVATDSRKQGEGPLYQSLLSVGRQVFQLCVGTLLVGAELAQSAGLEETLVTNQECFQKICRVLADQAISPAERLERIAPIVSATQQYQYVPESDLKLETMIGATRLAAKALLDHNEVISEELLENLERLTTAKRTDDHLQELEALQMLDSILHSKFVPAETIGSQAVRDLVKVVWGYVFMHYFWLKERPVDKTRSADSQAEQGT